MLWYSQAQSGKHLRGREELGAGHPGAKSKAGESWLALPLTAGGLGRGRPVRTPGISQKKAAELPVRPCPTWVFSVWPSDRPNGHTSWVLRGRLGGVGPAGWISVGGVSK